VKSILFIIQAIVAGALLSATGPVGAASVNNPPECVAPKWKTPLTEALAARIGGAEGGAHLEYLHTSLLLDHSRSKEFLVKDPQQAIGFGCGLPYYSWEQKPRDDGRPRPLLRTMWSRAERDAQAYHPAANLHAGDHDALDVILRRTRALLDDLSSTGAALEPEVKALDVLEREASRIKTTAIEARFELFERATVLRRRIAFRNPLLSDIPKILFIKRAGGGGNHMVDQFFGFFGRYGNRGPGYQDHARSGLYVLEDPFTARPKAVNLLENTAVENGRYRGRVLDGGFLSPDVSFDGQRILFAFTEGVNRFYEWDAQSVFHVFSVNAGGRGLRQLTDGAWNDFDPCWLPSGRVAFVSERRGGYGRCHMNRPVPTYTLHSMYDDGSDIVALSYHETNEWQPSVDHQGMLVYTRWDYVDRGSEQAHHAWRTTPDGRDSRAIGGNTRSHPNNTPYMEMNVRAIPGSRRLVAVATPHHGEQYGSLIMIDPAVVDDDAMAQVKRLTPEQLFPESEYLSRFHAGWNPGAYGTVWPLSENYYLCAYDPWANGALETADIMTQRYGLYLVDVFGNKELIYEDPAITCLSPIPLRARPVPPTIPHRTLTGLPPNLDGTKPPAPTDTDVNAPAEVGVLNVYNSQYKMPEGVKIARLRLWQVALKSTLLSNRPQLGYGAQKVGKQCLGTVPVEKDGSAYWLQPSRIPVYYQALDEKGVAVQGMRSLTYAHPGEKLVCNGCHDPRGSAPPGDQRPIALTRPPSPITPGPPGSNPFNYLTLVQPVLDRRCVGCHEKHAAAPDLKVGDPASDRNFFAASFYNLQCYVGYYEGVMWDKPKTSSGECYALGSRLYRMLRGGHHGVELSPEEFERLTIWMDSNGAHYAVDHDLQSQVRRLPIRPILK
jgi:hypothetical protein